jgi:hypothetical protein
LGTLIVPVAIGQDDAVDDKAQVGVSFTDDFEIRYRILDQRLPLFPDRAVFNYVEQVNRFTAQFNYKDWSGYAQVDEVALFANRFILDDTLTWERTLLQPDVPNVMPGDSYATVEKIWVKRDSEKVSVTLGDVYAAFGLGGALNLNRNVDVDVDTSIQGFKTQFRPTPSTELTAVAGQLNRQQVWQDNPNISLGGDMRHAMGGLRFDAFGIGPADVGVHGVAYDYVDEVGLSAGFKELGTTPDVIVGGLTTNLYGVGGVDWAAEANVFTFPTDVAFGGDETELGYAVYGAGSFYLGRTTWQLEGKRYLNAERLNAPVAGELYEVAVMPTLEYERSITEDSSATLNSNDVYGSRLRLDVSATDSVIPFASVGVFRDLETGGLHFNSVPETVVHPIAGAEVFLEHWTVLLNAGYRMDARDGTDAGSDRQLHADIDFKYPLPGHFHGDIAVGIERYQWGVNPLQQSDYLEMETAVALQYGSDVALMGYVDFSDNPLVDSTGNFSEDVYGAVEVQVKPAEAWTLKAFYGAYKAGIRCSGGQCRLLPGYEGARMSVVGNF